MYYICKKNNYIMTNKLLLPNRFKWIGCCLLIPATVIGFILTISDYESLQWNGKAFALFNDDFLGKNPSFGWIETNLTSTIVAVLFIIGALIVAFQKKKTKMNILQTSDCPLYYGRCWLITVYCFYVLFLSMALPFSQLWFIPCLLL